MHTRMRSIWVASFVAMFASLALVGCPTEVPQTEGLAVEPTSVELTEAAPEAVVTLMNMGDDIIEDALYFTASSDNENVALSAQGGSLPGDFEVDITITATAFGAEDATAVVTFENADDPEDAVTVDVTVKAAAAE